MKLKKILDSDPSKNGKRLKALKKVLHKLEKKRVILHRELREDTGKKKRKRLLLKLKTNKRHRHKAKKLIADLK